MKHCLFLILFLFSIPASAQDYSLLIGIGYEDSCDNLGTEPVYIQYLHTLLVTLENDSLKIVADIPEIILPTDTSYKRVGIKKSIYNEWEEDFYWFCPIEEEPEIKGIDSYRGEDCSGNENYKLLFAGNSYLLIENSGGGYCDGNAHPSFWYEYIWIPADTSLYTNTWDGPTFDIFKELDKMFDNNFHTEFIKDGEKVRAELSDDEKWGLEEEPTKITLYRESGKWKFGGEYYWGSEVSRGMTESFNVTLLPPESIVGKENLAIPWDTIASRFPNAEDAFTTPDGKILAVSNWNGLSFYKVINSVILADPVLQYEAPGTDFRVIMIESFRDDYKRNKTSYLKNLSENFWKFRHHIF